jgi:hypothetical protein
VLDLVPTLFGREAGDRGASEVIPLPGRSIRMIKDLRLLTVVMCALPCLYAPFGLKHLNGLLSV